MEARQARAAHALLAALRARGVRFLFGLPGSTEAAVLDALREAPDIRYVLTLQEGIAVAMADGYARASGQAGVVNLHTTVGTLAGLSLLYNAWRDRVPVVVLACHKDTRILGRGGFTTLPDTTALVRPLAKWAHQTLNPEQVGEDVERAFQQALAWPRGPAYVIVPENLLAAPVFVDPPRPAPVPSPPRPHPEAVREVVDCLSRSERAVLVVGTEVARGGAVEVAVQLAHALELPVLWESRRTLLEPPYPVEDPHFVGMYDPRHPAVAEAEVLVVVGATLFVEFAPPPAPEIPPRVFLVHVHPDAAELGRLYPPNLAVQAEAGLFLKDLLEAVRAEGRSLGDPGALRRAWVAELRARWEAQRAERRRREADRRPLSAFQVGETLGRVLPRETVVVEEAVRSCWAFLDGFPVRLGGLFRTAGGSLGWGVPAALGVQMALPGRPVVAVVGDGSLHFTPQALWTGVQQGLPVLVVVLNNRKYLAVEAGLRELLKTREALPSTPGIELPGIDHATVAQGYGAGGVRVEDPDALGDVVDHAFRRSREEGRPYLVDVPVREEWGG
ncbi:MAG: thiamine pyrophosphate-binding protein [Armatimonadota bacterium]|nr:thiamine pyrophosphate-binding protein [Armatimonadota bacterium]MDR7444561.1 thiamine pyrophosphate-binding protein [Armatimonadota bacterium]MDR7615351.1 thiamine pyrophosphate-binding protein [Armatimonadota bacterium]